MFDSFLGGVIEGVKLSLDMIWTTISADPALLALFLCIVGGSLVLGLIVRFLREQRLRKSGIREVDQMSGRKFEEYLQALLKTKGYAVQLTPATGDFGADLVLSDKGRKIVVQAKRYKKNVGVKAVQEIVSAKSYYKAEECWVITNSFFTAQAIKLARSNHVRLINRNELMNWMLKENNKKKVVSL